MDVSERCVLAEVIETNGAMGVDHQFVVDGLSTSDEFWASTRSIDLEFVWHRCHPPYTLSYATTSNVTGVVLGVVVLSRIETNRPDE